MVKARVARTKTISNALTPDWAYVYSGRGKILT